MILLFANSCSHLARIYRVIMASRYPQTAPDESGKKFLMPVLEIIA
jgi:hypothetical protein